MVEIKIPLDNLKKRPIYVNAFEAGILMGLILNSDKKDTLRDVFKQLLDLSKKFQEEAGVTVTDLGGTVTDLGNGYVMFTDWYGNTFIRQKYEWEE